jgi:hypothetical protein
MAPRILKLCTDCGYSKSYGSPAMAEHHFDKHSCERRLRAAETHARGLAKHAAVDRAPKPCLHPFADHQHGTYACYTLDKCRCLPCAVASGEYERNRVKEQAYGRWDHLVDAEPVRAHVRELMAAGLGCKRIPKLAGVPISTVNQLVFGKHRSDGECRPIRRIKRDTAEKLLALQADESLLAGGAKLPAVGSHRRLQALVCLGWSLSELGRRLGITPQNMGALRARDQVLAATARAVRELYDELWNCPPPETCHRERGVASRSRNYARRNGWLPPLTWDDATIDNPDAEPLTGGDGAGEPDEIKVDLIAAGRLQLPRFDRSPERTEAVRRLAAAGLSDGQIANRLDMGRDAVLKIRARNNIASPFTPAANSGASQQIDGIAARYGASEAVDPATLRRPPAA